jgi:hypothetical protein
MCYFDSLGLNLELTKKIKKVYELNKYFQNIEVVKVFWMEYFPHFASKVVQIQCKVCTQIDGKDKLLVPKLDLLWKHACHPKVLVTMLKV